MALQKKVTLDNGLSADKAYIRIENVWLCKGVKVCEMTINYYVQKPTDPNPIPFRQDIVKIFSDQYDNIFGIGKLKSNDPFEVGYVHLKTLTDFSDSTDV
jgi:hypothetical protein